MQLKNALNHSIALRADKRAYIAMLSIPAGVLVLSLWVAGEEGTSWWPVLIVLAYVAVVCSWLSLFRLELTSEEIRYRSLFRGRQSMSLRDIDRTELQIGVVERRDLLRGSFRLVIIPFATSNQRQLVVNLRVFPRDGLTELLDYLVPAQTAEESGTTRH